MIAISQLDVEPGNVFNVQWTAYMIFAVLIGRLGTIEGPVIGAVVFVVLQQSLAEYDVWYLIILGCVAMAMAIWARRGLWGLFTAKVPVHFFPVGYYVHLEDGSVRAACWAPGGASGASWPALPKAKERHQVQRTRTCDDDRTPAAHWRRACSRRQRQTHRGPRSLHRRGGGNRPCCGA